jgi:hypothetical protein
MGFIPHPEIPLGSLRPTDMLLLLVAGATWEVFLRLMMWSRKRKPTPIQVRELKLKALSRRVNKSRALGPPAFVETSKMERQQLAEEMALSELADARKITLAAWQKLSRNLNLGCCAVILFVYYGIPLLEFHPERVVPQPGEVLTVEDAGMIADSTMQAFLFPLSVIGMGIRASKWGLPNPKSSVGALLVFWSAQTTVGKIIDGIEALVL